VSLHVSGWSGCRLQLWHWTARSSVALCAPISVALAVRRTVKGVDFQREAGKESVELSAMRQVGPIHFFLLMCLLGTFPCRLIRAQQAEPPNPVLNQRPPVKPAPARSAVAAEGHIQLDVVVTDASGTPVTGLGPWDFSLYDNSKQRKILTFRAFNGATSKPDPPVEVILLIDMANLPFTQVAFVRQQVEDFLHENGGHLNQPVSLIVLTSGGIRVQPRPSVDGNALAGVVQQLKGNISTINPAMGGEGLLERFQLSARQLDAIAENEARKPGRKLLIWIGPGWPMLNRPSDSYSERDQQRNFESIVELSTRLREGRMVLYSVAPEDTAIGGGKFDLLYQEFLKPITSPKQAQPGNLGLKVLVTQTGGAIMGLDNDLAGQIDRCVGEANAFYRISFDPAPAEHADEHHELKLLVDKPGLTVRTSTGYYNEP
jgi:VWFA-related protein